MSRMSSRVRTGAGAALLLLLSPGISAPRAELQPLTLYQRAGRAPWIILGEVTDGDDRFSQVKVLEVLKGDYGLPTLRIVHRLENFLRKSWEEKLDFKTGEAVCLFLKRYEPDREGGKVPEKLQAADMFASSFGAQGKFDLPAEGQPAYVEAIREFIRVTGLSDPVEQERSLIAFLESENPHVLQAGLEQILERRLATEEQIPVLLRLADHEREPIRLNALQVLGQIAEDLAVAKKTFPNQADVVNQLKGKVMGGGSDIYRAEAVRVVAALAGESERSFLDRISKEDASQLVRYQASSALMQLNP